MTTYKQLPKLLAVKSRKRAGQNFVVLGGGICGLAATRELLRRGCNVSLIEKATEVGGLARTFEHECFRFDIGGHRFHSNNASVVEWLKELLQSDLLFVPRTSHIYLNGQFVNYPIQFPGALSIFSPFKAVQMVASYLAAKVTESQRQDISFEDWVIKRYGKGLYEVFFKPYTEKVWGIPCDRLSATWASQRIGIPSMWRTIQHAIQQALPLQQLFPAKPTPATAISQFYYPRFGFGMIPQTLNREIEEMGGAVYTGTSLHSCTPTTNGFEVKVQQASGAIKTITADSVISTIPLNYLLNAIPPQFGSQEILDKYNLEYRDLICLFIALKKKQVSEDSWTYFPSQDFTFGRTHEPKNWSQEMVPNEAYTSLAVEIFASRGEPVWEMSDGDISNLVIEQLSDISWIDRSEVYKTWVLRVPYAYPIYHIGYQEKLRAVKEYLSQWRNLHLVGRTGSFHYMNSDGVIEDVFRLIKKLFPEETTEISSLKAEIGRWT